MHNLYLETLAELGPIGLALLAATLLVPLVAAVRARHRSLVPIAASRVRRLARPRRLRLGLGAARGHDRRDPVRRRAARRRTTAERGRATATGALGPARTAPSVAGVAALFGLLGNRALARGNAAIHAGNLSAAAAAARDARRWAPWSSAPWAQLAFIRQIQGNTAAGERAAYKQAVAQDPHNWELWLGLLTVSHGAARAHALAALSDLNPAAAAGVRGKALMPGRDPLADPEPLLRSASTPTSPTASPTAPTPRTSRARRSSGRFATATATTRARASRSHGSSASPATASTTPNSNPAAKRPAPEPTRPGIEGEVVGKLTLQHALASLSPDDQELLALRYGADLPVREIAKLLERRTNSVEVALSRARTRLASALDPGETEAQAGIEGGAPGLADRTL